CSWSFFVYDDGDHRDLHSFPTRRSSDLGCGAGSLTRRTSRKTTWTTTTGLWPRRSITLVTFRMGTWISSRLTTQKSGSSATSTRSEEHTSELQSRENLVCRLLLEKKKKH